jgi:hypothetical protein
VGTLSDGEVLDPLSELGSSSDPESEAEPELELEDESEGSPAPLRARRIILFGANFVAGRIPLAGWVSSGL